MKNTVNKLIAFLLAAIMLALANVQVIFATTSNITIKLNNEVLKFDVVPRIVNGRTLVPVATLVKHLGASTEWKPDTKSVIITLPTKNNNKTIYLKIGQAVALIDGVEVKMDTAAVIYGNRTFVPLRFISENFGAKVEWIAKTRTINITYQQFHNQEIPPELIPPWELQQIEITTGTAVQIKQ